MNEQEFWLVWNIPHGEPRYRHMTEAAAMREAERLAGIHKGSRFYIVKAIAYSEKVEVHTFALSPREHVYEESLQMPF